MVVLTDSISSSEQIRCAGTLGGETNGDTIYARDSDVAYGGAAYSYRTALPDFLSMHEDLCWGFLNHPPSLDY